MKNFEKNILKKKKFEKHFEKKVEKKFLKKKKFEKKNFEKKKFEKSGNWGLDEIDCHRSHKGQCTSEVIQL